MDSQAADAIWESWWAGDMTGYAVGLAWWAITDDEKYGELDFFGTRARHRPRSCVVGGRANVQMDVYSHTSKPYWLMKDCRIWSGRLGIRGGLTIGLRR